GAGMVLHAEHLQAVRQRALAVLDRRNAEALRRHDGRRRQRGDAKGEAGQQGGRAQAHGLGSVRQEARTIASPAESCSRSCPAGAPCLPDRRRGAGAASAAIPPPVAAEAAPTPATPASAWSPASGGGAPRAAPCASPCARGGRVATGRSPAWRAGSAA